MKITSAEFHLSAPDLKSCPTTNRPEVAFIGRSNVGKSSLINLLAGRRDLALVSDLPGKTKLMNFFTINRAWSLVDLPGYGYAKVSRQQRFDFNQAVADYLEKRPNLQGVFVLIDSRHPPHDVDLEFIRWLDTCPVPYALIFTKTDKESPNRVQNNIALFKQTLDELAVDLPDVLTSSTKSQQSRAPILTHIDRWLKAPRETEAG